MSGSQGGGICPLSARPEDEEDGVKKEEELSM
jgi:hypothetical protein